MKNAKVEKLIKKRLPASASAIILTTVITSAVFLEWSAYRAGVKAEKEITRPHALGKNFCFTCHSDAKSRRAIQEKRGDYLPPVPKGDLKALPGHKPAKTEWGK